MKSRPPIPSDSITSPVPEVPQHKGSSAFVTSTSPVVTPKKAPPQMPKAEAKPPTGPPPPVQAQA
eukprot:6337174-Amphidinium_carterae.1